MPTQDGPITDARAARGSPFPIGSYVSVSRGIEPGGPDGKSRPRPTVARVTGAESRARATFWLWHGPRGADSGEMSLTVRPAISEHWHYYSCHLQPVSFPHGGAPGVNA